MATFTIQHVIDTFNYRDAKKIFAGYIRSILPYDGLEWRDAMVFVKGSPLVNQGKGVLGSREIPNVSPSQIIDRMNVSTAAWLAGQVKQFGPDALGALRNAALSVKADGWAPSTDSAWPFVFVEGKVDGLIVDGIGALEIDDNWFAPSGNGDSASEASEASAGEDEEIAVDQGKVDMANMMIDVVTGGKVKDIRAVFDQVKQLKRELAAAKAAPAAVARGPVVASGSVPNGKVTTVNAQKVFGLRSVKLDFEIPVYSWDAPNPHVPQVDPSYKFNVDTLADLLFAIVQDVKAWLSGHTGTGKSTLVMQACARMGYMVRRVNFDSDQSRYDLIGKVDVSGGSTFFAEGVIPQAMQMPCVLLLDEADAIRGDIAYALQPVLEGNALMLTEDGGRLVYPDAGFRIVATGNSRGNGDTSGLYSAGVKMQSRASLNRYGVFIDVDYMTPAEEMGVVRKQMPNVSDYVANTMQEFLRLYRTAFRAGQISTPISPRNTFTVVQYATFFEPRLGGKAALERALSINVMGAADEADRDVIKGLADKVVA